MALLLSAAPDAAGDSVSLFPLSALRDLPESHRTATDGLRDLQWRFRCRALRTVREARDHRRRWWTLDTSPVYAPLYALRSTSVQLPAARSTVDAQYPSLLYSAQRCDMGARGTACSRTRRAAACPAVSCANGDSGPGKLRIAEQKVSMGTAALRKYKHTAGSWEAGVSTATPLHRAAVASFDAVPSGEAAAGARDHGTGCRTGGWLHPAKSGTGDECGWWFDE